MNNQELPGEESTEPLTQARGGKIFNRAALLNRIGGQSAMVPQLLSMFIATVDETLALMEKSAAEKDADESRRLSHTLKGVAANMGADRMYAIIAEIETFARMGDLEAFGIGIVTLQMEYEMFKNVALA